MSDITPSRGSRRRPLLPYVPAARMCEVLRFEAKEVLVGLDNVAVQWPRTGRFYDPVAPAEFVDFAELAERLPQHAGPAAALADHIA